MDKFDELKKLAAAASPGPWTYEGMGRGENGGRYYGVADAEFNEVSGEFGVSEDNAQYIAAANPSAILELFAIQAQLVEALKGTIALAWEDTREVKFDSTVMFGLGYDWDGWESFRMEIHTPVGAWAVWQSFGKYSAYGTHDGSMWFEKFKTREEAEEGVLTQIDRLCPSYPTTIARAALAAAGAQS